VNELAKKKTRRLPVTEIKLLKEVSSLPAAASGVTVSQVKLDNVSPYAKGGKWSGLIRNKFLEPIGTENRQVKARLSNELVENWDEFRKWLNDILG